MRLLVSLLLSLALVGAGYWGYNHFLNRPDSEEAAEAPAPRVAPSRAAPPTPPVEAPKPAPADPPATPPEAEAAPSVTRPPAQWSAVEMRILELTNAARATAHLSPLKSEDVLRDCALVQSADMIERNFFDHVNPSGEDPADRLSRIHRQLVGTAGENIWRAQGASFATRPDLAEVIMDGWMHSPGHRANILRPQFTHLGVGVVIRGAEIRATQSFAHVRAYLNAPLRPAMTLGTAVDLTTHGDPPAAELYDLNPLRGTPPLASQVPLPIAGAILKAPAGSYVVHLYFPTGGTNFSVFPGPSFAVGNR